MRVSTGAAFVAALALGAALSVVPLQVAGAQSPSTSVLVPSSGATLSGSTYLDASASNATSVEFLLFGGSYGYAAPVVCTATLTYYGWICAWDTTTVTDGSYALVSEGSGTGGTTFSAPININVHNGPPSTTVVLPYSLQQLDPGTGYVLDATAWPPATQVSIEFVNEAGTVVYSTSNATPTLYGWIVVVPPCGSCVTNNPVPVFGLFAIESVASFAGGVTATSPPVDVTLITYTTPPP